MSDWTSDDIPDQTGRTILITGANSGIGFEAARALAANGAHVVLACRSVPKAEEAAATIAGTDPSGSTEILEMDLADLDSVASAARTFLDTHDRLDVLVNNAGLMATPLKHTVQGYEMQFGVNHLGHFALTGHLLDVLAASGTDDVPARVVTISSQAHRQGKIDVDTFDGSGSYNPWRAYGQSKLANLLFMRELAERCDDADLEIMSLAAHPGGSDTNLGNESAGDLLSRVLGVLRPLVGRFVTQSAAMGALPTLRAAVDPDARSGDYFGPDGFGEFRGHPKRVGMTDRAEDDAVAARLWEISIQLSGVSYLA
ncbi:MAG: oxidoreductase [Ilumatobacter sp.]|uniref:oxidoreductase n=1 Tax=Ilumatobacter sp. TaxID=1967498 RepID=UPI00391D6456